MARSCGFEQPDRSSTLASGRSPDLRLSELEQPSQDRGPSGATDRPNSQHLQLRGSGGFAPPSRTPDSTTIACPDRPVNPGATTQFRPSLAAAGLGPANRGRDGVGGAGFLIPHYLASPGLTFPVMRIHYYYAERASSILALTAPPHPGSARRCA